MRLGARLAFLGVTLLLATCDGGDGDSAESVAGTAGALGGTDAGAGMDASAGSIETVCDVWSLPKFSTV